MALFKKKKKEEQIEEVNPQVKAKKENDAIILEVLSKLNEKLNGTLYDNGSRYIYHGSISAGKRSGHLLEI